MYKDKETLDKFEQYLIDRFWDLLNCDKE